MLLTFLSLVILWIFSRCQLSLLRRRQLMLIAKIMDSGGKLLLLLSRFSHVWLCDPIDGSPPGSPIPGILQAKTLEWAAISFSNAWKWKVKVKLPSHVRLIATHGLQPTRLRHPWDFPGKSTGVGCYCLLHFATPQNVKCLLFANFLLLNLHVDCYLPPGILKGIIQRQVAARHGKTEGIQV